MQSTATSREHVLSVHRRLATLALLEIRLKERQAVLRKAYRRAAKHLKGAPMDEIDQLKSMPSDELWKLHEAVTAQLGSKLSVEKVKLAERERRLSELLERLDTGSATESGPKRVASLP